MTLQIQAALAKLDAANDEHWTADGMPRMDVMEELVGESITRKDVTDALPDFSRAKVQAAQDGQEEASSASEGEAEETAKLAAEGAGADAEDANTGEIADVSPEDAADLANLAEEMAADEHDPFAILRMNMAQILKTEEGMLEFRSDASTIMAIWSAEKKELDDKVMALGRASQMVDRLLTRIENSKPQSDTADIRAYLASQQKARAARAKRTLAFLEHGVNPAELAKALQGKSQLDVALGLRKPAPGSTRPDPRIPVRGTRQAGG